MISYRLEVRYPETEEGQCVSTGTAWAITSDIVVTAFHAVADDSEEWLSDVVGVTYRLRVGNVSVELESVACDKGADVALLRRAKTDDIDESTRLEILTVGEWGAAPGADWIAPGFASVASGECQTLIGKITRFDPNSMNGGFELYVAQGSDTTWIGASGSPVCVDGRVVGVLTTEVGGAATVRASDVESVLRLLRLEKARHLREICIELLSQQPIENLRAVLRNGHRSGRLEDGAVEVLAKTLVGRAARLGGAGMAALLVKFGANSAIEALTQEIANIALISERRQWPHWLTTVDENRKKHTDWTPPATLLVEWETFVQRRRWDEHLNYSLQVLVSKLKRANADPEIVQRFELFDTSRCYRMMCAELTHLIDRAESRLRTGLSGNATVEPKEISLAFVPVRSLISRNTPRGRCLFLMGSTGSGKTHFVESILAQEKVDWRCPLVLSVSIVDVNPLTRDGLERAILRALESATGRAFVSLTEFQRTLDAMGASRAAFLVRTKLSGSKYLVALPRLVIAIDDLHEAMTSPDVADRLCRILQEIIDESTACASVHWLFTLQDTRYDQIRNPPEPPSFWEEYGCVGGYGEQPRNDDGTWHRPDKVPAKGGWLDLDRINQADGVGLAILRDKLGNRKLSAALSKACESGRNPSILHYLHLPWVAWIFHALDGAVCERAIETGDLHYVVVVEKMRAARVETIDSSHAERLVTQRYFRILAAVLLSGDGRQCRDEEFTSHARKAAAKAKYEFEQSELQLRVDKLIGAGLLKSKHEQLREHLEVYVEALWSYEGARLFIEELASLKSMLGLRARLETTFCDSAIHEGLRLKEGVLEFVLLLADRDQPQLSGRLVQEILASEILTRTGLWFAASKSSEDFQRLVVNSNKPPLPYLKDAHINRRLLLARMAFVERVSPSVLAHWQRLELMRNEYERLYENAFVTYYFDVVAQIIEEVRDSETLRECMSALRGCERVKAHFAEHLAERVVARLFEIENGAAVTDAEGNTVMVRVLSVVFGYLRDGLEDAIQEHKLRSATFAAEKRTRLQGQRPDHMGDSTYDARWRREFFREWVLRAFCLRVVEELGPADTFRFLKEQNWFTRIHVGRPVVREMIREATMAMGNYFHSRPNLFCVSHAESIAFLELVQELASSERGRDREHAFHLIRHTRPTLGDYEVQISEVFYPFLIELAKDAKLTKMGSFRGLYKRNIGPLRPLVSNREAKIRKHRS